MANKRKKRNYDDPLFHTDHPRPVTRRQFLSQGFIGGSAYTLGGGVLSLFSNPREAHAALAPDLANLRNACGIAANGAGKIPFICFDLAGGANIFGSNVLCGQEGGQLDLLTAAGYRKMGLPDTMLPGMTDPTDGLDYANFDLGLGFHKDSAFRRGILDKLAVANAANVNGALIPARSDNDTGNNPHNPMYGIARAGADGQILTLCGSENTDSGGNSALPMQLYDPELRPTKVDRPSDVVNLVDTGDLVGILTKDDATMVMESIYRLTDDKMDQVNTQVTADAVIKELVRCNYLKAADIADRFGGVPIDPGEDEQIVQQAGSAVTGIFTQDEFFNQGRDSNEFQKTASVMKLVLNGYAGAGCIEMGGYDYHGGRRAEGEVKDFRAGRCMGAVLEYAARLQTPVMLYVFSDGSLSSNGAIDTTLDGRDKGEWTSDNSSTAGSFFLVYNPIRRPTLVGPANQQIGYMSADGSVMRGATPAANNVPLLVNTLLLNYMALHGETALNGNDLFSQAFPNHGLGNATMQASLTAFQPIVNGTTANPVL